MSICRLSPRNPQSGGCGAEWHGTQAAHTCCCHETFSSNAAADLAHGPNRKCLNPTTLPFFEPNDRFGNPYWTVDPVKLDEWKAEKSATRGVEVGSLGGVYA